MAFQADDMQMFIGGGLFQQRERLAIFQRDAELESIPPVRMNSCVCASTPG